MEQLLSIESTAEKLGISPWTIRAHLRNHTISATRLGCRVLISQGEIRRIMREGLPSLRAKSHSDGEK